jgi:hypothetical protein
MVKKAKAKFSLGLNLLTTMPWKHIGELDYSSTILYLSAVVVGEWPVSRPGRITLGERSPGTN